MIISYDDFARVDVRIGTVLSAAANPGARKPAYLLEIDFGPGLGRKKGSAQVTRAVHSRAAGRPAGGGGGQLSAKQIARMVSEVLVLGSPTPRAESR